MTSSPAPEEAIRDEHWLERANREYCERLGAGKCAHCEGAPEISGGGQYYWRVTCKSCGAQSGMYPTDVEAVAAWNRRAGGERETWQPIETAPKQDVIILTNGGALYQGFWQDGFGWMTGHDDGVMHVRVLLQPTHWMPLPAPPRAALAGQTEGERNGG